MMPDILVRTLIDFTLGDGSIQKYKETHNATFKMEHSIKQREYLWHKIDVLRQLGLEGKEAFSTRTLKNREAAYDMCSCVFRQHPAINTAYKWSYNKGRKAIDKALINQLDAKSLAYFFMDDGSGPKTYRSVSKINGVRYMYTYPQPKIEHYSLSTYNCTLDELRLLQDWLLGAFGIATRLKLDKRAKTCYGAFIVTCGIENKDKFRDTVRPFIIPSMLYKIEGAHTFEGIKYNSVQHERLSGETPTSEIAEEDAIVCGF